MAVYGPYTPCSKGAAKFFYLPCRNHPALPVTTIEAA
jgi:hypothetical protein